VIELGLASPLVRRDRTDALESRMIDMPAAIAAGRTDFMAIGMQAHCGAPVEEGEEMFATLTDPPADLVREVAAC
jgi:creatinine amidohydrolase